MRKAYVNAAVGWVQVCREAEECYVRAKICPEHNISKHMYDVMCTIKDEKIASIKCFGCAASEGVYVIVISLNYCIPEF